MSDPRERCRRYRRRILDLSQRVAAMHVAPAFSCIEIIDTIYDIMRPHDIFILSKGHAAIAQYVVLEDRGVLSDIEHLGAHPDYGTPGIAASTGSLGHGLSIAIGRAIAAPKSNVYVLLSDGEMQAGPTWEAMLIAANLHLTNLIALVDNNDFTGLDRISKQWPAFYPLTSKSSAFWWDVATCNGHSWQSIMQRFTMRSGKRPFMLLCTTCKGHGVSFMENAPIWHYRSPNAAEYAQAIAELESAK
jgi:transketolase